MKTLRSHGVGGPDSLVLDDVADPVPGPGEVLIAVRSCAINYPDALMIRDLYQFKPQRPYAPGGEVSGIVEAVGEGVTAFQVGDRVLGSCSTGGLAEKVVAQTTRLYPLPDGVSFEAGSALLMTYGTTIYGLKDRGNLKPGETLLILGAAGGVGLSAVELGKAMGARVIAGASTPEKLQIAREFGADELIDYSAQDLKATLKALTGGKGVDVIYDPVGDRLAEPAFRSIAWQGRYLVVGFAGGQIPAIPLNLPLVKGASIVGVFWGESTDRAPKEHAENMAELYGWLVQGKLKPLISKRFMLEDAGAAIRWVMDRKATGKVVVDMGASG